MLWAVVAVVVAVLVMRSMAQHAADTQKELEWCARDREDALREEIADLRAAREYADADPEEPF